jgi:hypothetical protein
MLVKDLIEEFSKIDRLPVDLKLVADALRAKDVEDEIYYFHDNDLSPNSFEGSIVREEINYGTDIRFISTITYAKLGEEMERLVCCKEMLHILDPDYVKSRTIEDVETLISQIILPPEFSDPQDADLHTNWDKIGIAHAIAVLMPMTAIEILRPALEAKKITVEEIAEIAELPLFAVNVAMSERWRAIHAALVKRFERQVM